MSGVSVRGKKVFLNYIEVREDIGYIGGTKIAWEKIFPYGTAH